MENEIPEPAPIIDFRRLYDHFDAPLMDEDCGRMCARRNPRGVPACCDICLAVPAAYHGEWGYLRESTDLWHIWRGDECSAEPADPTVLRDEIPEHMLLLACRGAARCQRAYRTLSCRQFPFFPYVASDYRFLGLACHWDFEKTCWTVSNLEAVSQEYRRQFVQTYDEIFALWQEDFESYAASSEALRAYSLARRRRFPLLHRNGGYYLVSPGSERMQRVPPEELPKYW
jgi:hypothetical protein